MRAMICPCIAGMYCRFLLILLQMGILQSGGLVNKIKDIGRGVINLVFPPRCPVCDGIIGPVERYIHSRCCEKLFPVEQPQCMRCGKPVLSERREYCDDCARALEHHRQMREDDSYRQGKALFAYKGSIKQTMYRFKYSNRREYAAYFAQTAVERYSDWIQSCGIDVIIPVPMHRKKMRQRGYNQAECFARALSEKTGIRMAKGLVRRVKNTSPLKTMGYVERRNCLEGAFQVADSIVQYDQILIVDDIYTTGSTAESIGHEIAKRCPGRVYVLCICIGQGS